MSTAPKDLIVYGCLGDISAGKTTVGKLMSPWGFMLLNYADPLKELAYSGFDWDGQKDPKGRRLLQVIGTEAGRTYNPNLWVSKLAKRIDDNYKAGLRRFVICDCRFDNEMSWIVNKLGGTLVHVRRTEAEKKAVEEQKVNPHASEKEWKEAVASDKYHHVEIDNNGPLPETFANVYQMMEDANIKLI